MMFNKEIDDYKYFFKSIDLEYNIIDKNVIVINKLVMLS